MKENIDKDVMHGRGKKYPTRNFKSNKRQAKLDPENTPTISGMRKIHGNREGYVSVRNKVLFRWLTSKIGQHIDKVYSELSEQFKKNTFARDQVDYVIDWNLDGLKRPLTYYKDGRIFHSNCWNHRQIELQDGSLYIDNDKIIRQYKRKKQTSYTSLIDIINAKRVVTDDKEIQYHKLLGIWYELKVRRLTEDEANKKMIGRYVHSLEGKSWHYDGPSFLNHLSDWWDEVAKQMKYEPSYSMWTALNYFFGVSEGSTRTMYLPISKRQLNKKEVKQIEKKLT